MWSLFSWSFSTIKIVGLCLFLTQGITTPLVATLDDSESEEVLELTIEIPSDNGFSEDSELSEEVPELTIETPSDNGLSDEAFEPETETSSNREVSKEAVELKNETLPEANIFREAFQNGLLKAAYYVTHRGHELRYAHFKSPVRGPKDTVFFLQTSGTFLEYYEALVVPLLERGLDVWMYDLSGQGGSTRLLSKESHDEKTVRLTLHIDSYELYEEDAHDFIHEVVLPQAKGRLLLGGYSTGGHIALRYLQRFPETPFASAFVISPHLSTNVLIPNKALLTLFWGASWLINLDRSMLGSGSEDPIVSMSFEGNPLTSGENEFKEIQKLCIQHQSLTMAGVSYNWIKAGIESLEKLWMKPAIEAIRIPVLIASGTDKSIDVSSIEQFANALENSRYVCYSTGRKELFREKPEIRAQWWADFDGFLSE